jgi:hypothetical protein
MSGMKMTAIGGGYPGDISALLGRVEDVNGDAKNRQGKKDY